MMVNIIGNRGGIPFITATQTSAGSTTTNAVYTLPNHTFRFLGCTGLIVVNIPTATATTVTGVQLITNNKTLSLTSQSGEALTSLIAGIHLIVFSKSDNGIRLLI